MADLQQFSLTQFRQLMDGQDEQMAHFYLSQNLAILRDVDVSLFRQRFTEEPVLLHEMRILVITEGWAAPIINLQARRFEAGDLVFLGPDGLMQYGSMAPRPRGFGLSMSSDLLTLAVGNHRPRAFDGRVRDFHFHLQADDLHYLDALHHLLYINARAQGGSAQVSLHLVSAFLLYVDHLWSRHDAAERKAQSREQQLFADFMQLVSQYAPQQHGISFYADKLYLSPRYMSAIVKQVSGKAAKHWIDEAIVARIKVELKHTHKQVAQISDDMGFPNVSFFCKYFKRLTGLTPMAYKEGVG